MVLSLEVADGQDREGDSGMCDKHHFGWKRTALAMKRDGGCADGSHHR